MQDPIVQFPNAGFDSPEVREQIAAVFEQLRAAFAALAEACREAMQSVARAVASFIPCTMWAYRELCRLHLIPRQHRLTIMRKKVRRYAREMGR